MNIDDNYYLELKSEYLNHKAYKTTKQIRDNMHDLSHYYNIGKILYEAQGGEKRARYGDGLIKNYSKRMSEELGEGYSPMSLKNMRKYYMFQKRQALPVQLTWSHIIELLKLNNLNEIKYYSNEAIKKSLGYRQLRELIKSKEYERLSDVTKNKLVKSNDINVGDLIKNPIVIPSNNNDLKEKELQQIILSNMSLFLHQLGDGFAFVDNEYKLLIGNTFNYIDLLLYNYIYKCFCVIELKVTELKKEHIGQINTYMNFIDENIRTLDDNKTMGVILYKDGDNYLLHYCNNDNIYATKYITI